MVKCHNSSRGYREQLGKIVIFILFFFRTLGKTTLVKRGEGWVWDEIRAVASRARKPSGPCTRKSVSTYTGSVRRIGSSTIWSYRSSSLASSPGLIKTRNNPRLATPCQRGIEGSLYHSEWTITWCFRNAGTTIRSVSPWSEPWTTGY